MWITASPIGGLAIHNHRCCESCGTAAWLGHQPRQRNQATATALTFDEPQAGGCVGGTVTFTRHGAGLAYRWTDNVEQNTATLRKS